MDEYTIDDSLNDMAAAYQRRANIYGAFAPSIDDVTPMYQAGVYGTAASNPQTIYQQSSDARTAALRGGTGASSQGNNTGSRSTTATGLPTITNKAPQYSFGLTSQDPLLQSLSLSSLTKKPEYPNIPTASLPTYTAPERDERRQAFLSDKAGRVPTSSLRKTMENQMPAANAIPEATLRNATLRAVLSGYGSGLANVLDAAQRAGQAQYNTEYAGEVDEAKMGHATSTNQEMLNYGARRDAALTQYQADMARYNQIMNTLLSLSTLMQNPYNTSQTGLYPLMPNNNNQISLMPTTQMRLT